MNHESCMLCNQYSLKKLLNLFLIGFGIIFDDLTILDEFDGRESFDFELVGHIGLGLTIHGLEYNRVSVNHTSIQFLFDFIKHGLGRLAMRTPIHLEQVELRNLVVVCTDAIRGGSNTL